MTEEKKEQKIDLKNKAISDDNLNQVSGGTDILLTCPKCNGRFGLRPGPRPGTYDCPICGIVHA